MAPPPLFRHDTDDVHLASPLGMTFLLGLSLVLSGVYILGVAVYNLYFHPLRKFPGPRLWIAFPFLRHVSAMQGHMDFKIRQYHDKYGDVVRIANNHLSFITPQAWTDIYGHGHRQFPKTTPVLEGETHNIINSNNENHTRFRRALAHAFSDRALRAQEPLMVTYVDLLIHKLRDFATTGAKADMVSWYNYTTFDLIGDLSFGEPFNCLKDSEMHFWVAGILNFLKTLPFVRMVAEYPMASMVFKYTMPAKVRKARAEQMNLARERVRTRTENTGQHGRNDFMDFMLKRKDGKDDFTFDELVSNAQILILAGSETTATLLSGVTYWLLKTPGAMKKVTDEVRSAFDNEEDINFINATARLPYMLACLDEAFRMYPPVPTNLLRQIPSGPSATISGYEVPATTCIGVHQSAAYSSSRNFRHPHSFVPERWLPEFTDPSSASPYVHDNRAVVQPFSVGPRNCIGRNLAYNEMRLILARVLWNFDLELCEESEHWNEQRSYVLWEKGPLWCKLKVRDGVKVDASEKIAEYSSHETQENEGEQRHRVHD